MESRGWEFWSKDVTIGSVGLTLMVLAEPTRVLFDSWTPWVQPSRIVISIGIGLFVAAVTGVIMRYRSLGTPDPRGTIRTEPYECSPLRGQYRARKFNSRQVDMLGLLCAAQLTTLAGEDSELLLRRLRDHHAKYRVLILDPRSDYVRTRADEVYGGNPDEFRRRILKSVELAEKIHQNLHHQINGQEPASRGEFEVRITDHPHNVWMLRYDSNVVWGFYPSHVDATQSNCLCLSKEVDSALFDQLCSHFGTLWESGAAGESGRNSYLVRWEPSYRGSQVNNTLIKELKNACEQLRQQDNCLGGRSV